MLLYRCSRTPFSNQLNWPRWRSSLVSAVFISAMVVFTLLVNSQAQGAQRLTPEQRETCRAQAAQGDNRQERRQLFRECRRGLLSNASIPQSPTLSEPAPSSAMPANNAATDPKFMDADEAIGIMKSFLSSLESESESTELQGSAVEDLNGDGQLEIVFVWTLLGPTYWRNNLTVLAKTANGYQQAAEFSLEGYANLSSVMNGLIYVDQTLYAENDGRCCPSIKKQMKYRWIGKTIEIVE